MNDWPTKEECAAFYDAMTDPNRTFWIGVEKERQANRIIAFGAIRRAAEVARHHDCEARIIECGSTDFANRLAAEHFCLAKAVRRAIRAAIGLDKA